MKRSQRPDHPSHAAHPLLRGGVVLAVNCNLRYGPDPSSVQLCSSHDMRRETKRMRAGRASNRVIRLCHKFSCRRWTCGSTRARLANGVLESQRHQWGGLRPALPHGYRRLADSLTMDRKAPTGHRLDINIWCYLSTISTLSVTPLAHPSISQLRCAFDIAVSLFFFIIYLITCVPTIRRLPGKCLYLTSALLFRTYQHRARSSCQLYNRLDTATSDSKAARLVSASTTPISSCAKKRLGKEPLTIIGSTYTNSATA
jgi:hypothetical protein